MKPFNDGIFVDDCWLQCIDTVVIAVTVRSDRYQRARKKHPTTFLQERVSDKDDIEMPRSTESKETFGGNATCPKRL